MTLKKLVLNMHGSESKLKPIIFEKKITKNEIVLLSLIKDGMEGRELISSVEDDLLPLKPFEQIKVEISQKLKKLEGKKMIVRKKHKKDKRVVQIFLTEKAKKILNLEAVIMAKRKK